MSNLTERAALLEEFKKTKKELRRCEKKLKKNEERNFDNLELGMAVMRGFQEGGETVQLATALPMFILVTSHVVSINIPALIFYFIRYHHSLWLYRAHYRFQEAKQKIAREKALLPHPLPATPSISQRLAKCCCSLFDKLDQRNQILTPQLQPIGSYSY